MMNFFFKENEYLNRFHLLVILSTITFGKLKSVEKLKNHYTEVLSKPENNPRNIRFT